MKRKSQKHFANLERTQQNTLIAFNSDSWKQKKHKETRNIMKRKSQKHFANLERTQQNTLIAFNSDSWNFKRKHEANQTWEIKKTYDRDTWNAKAKNIFKNLERTHEAQKW